MTPPASASSAGEEHNFNFELFDRSQASTNDDGAKSTQSMKHIESSLDKPFFSRGGKIELKRRMETNLCFHMWDESPYGSTACDCKIKSSLFSRYYAEVQRVAGPIFAV